MQLKRVLSACRITALTVLTAMSALAVQADVEVGELELIDSTRVGRTDFQYTYRVNVSNTGGNISNVSAVVTSSSDDTEVVEGELSFPDIVAGGAVLSSDTFEILHNRSVPFDPEVLSFEFTFEDGIFDPADKDRDGFSPADGDCNDADPAINPDAESIPDNNIDENCDGLDPVVNPALSVRIIAPTSLTTVGASPISVRGEVDDPQATLTVNGAPVTPDSQGVFNASVALQEGHNSIVARAVKASTVVTDSIAISLDLTPPYVTIESHQDGQDVFADKITVTGLINDIVRGTVEGEQASVEVNGRAATISNRSYSATDIPLVQGVNTISVSGTDQVGNVGSVSIVVNYVVPVGAQIELASGQGQSGPINGKLSAPLAVKVVDESKAPVEDAPVVFRVIQGSGSVGADTASEGRAVVIQTNAQGMADTGFVLGSRVGTANHKVRAEVVGYEGEIVFTASAVGNIGNKISVNSGNNQRGAVGQVLPEALVVAVTDDGANVVSNARVRFEVLQGGGSLARPGSNSFVESFETTTDSDGRATAEYKLGFLPGLDAQRITAILLDAPKDGNGQTLLVSAGFTATGFVPGDAGNTSVSGVVLDNQDVPIPGVTVRVDGTTRQAITDEQGRFVITESPVGPVHLVADGSTASVPGEFPALSYNIVTVSGVDNPLSGPIYMVKLDTDNSVFAGPEDVVLEMDKFPGFKLEIAKDSVTFPDGAREGLISVTAVNASKVPMPPPNGMQPQFIVTIQPTGTRFDPPATLSLPNVDGHLPGAQVEMYSYDHDLEEFVSIGLGTVSEDSTVITSNPGVGIIKAGWHCGSQPNEQGCCSGGGNNGNGCGPCKKSQSNDCRNNDCVPDPTQDPGPCKKCSSEGPVPDDSDTPEGENAPCQKCEGGSAVGDENKNGIKCSTDANKACYTCKDGSCGNNCQIVEPSVKTTIKSSPEFLNLSRMITRGANKIPYARLSSSIEFSGTNEVGTECCASCTSESSSPQPFHKVSGNGKIEGKLEVVVPGTGAIGEEEYELFEAFGTKYIVYANWKFGVFIDTTISAGAGIEVKNTSCPGEDCASGSIGAGGTLAGGLTGGAGGGYKEVENGKTVFQEGLSGKVEGRAVTGYSIKGTKGFTDGCPPDKCEWGHDGIKLEAEITFTIDIGIFAEDFSVGASATIVGPDKGDC